MASSKQKVVVHIESTSSAHHGRGHAHGSSRKGGESSKAKGDHEHKTSGGHHSQTHGFRGRGGFHHGRGGSQGHHSKSEQSIEVRVVLDQATSTGSQTSHKGGARHQEQGQSKGKEFTRPQSHGGGSHSTGQCHKPYGNPESSSIKPKMFDSATVQSDSHMGRGSRGGGHRGGYGGRGRGQDSQIQQYEGRDQRGQERGRGRGRGHGSHEATKVIVINNYIVQDGSKGGKPAHK